MGVRRNSERNNTRIGNRAFIGVLSVIGVLVIAGAVFLGKADKGTIDVTAAIQDANQMNADNQGNPDNNVAEVPEVFRSLPNGGLVPTEGAVETPLPAPAETVIPEASSTATTTTDTPAVTEEEGIQETATTPTEGEENTQNAGQ